MKDRRLKVVARHAPAAPADRPWSRWLALSVLAHAGALAALSTVVVRGPATPTVAAEFVFMEMPVKILPADGEPDTDANGFLQRQGTRTEPGGAAPVLMAMSWSPLATAKLPRMPVIAPPSAGEVFGVEASDLTPPAGAWIVAASKGDGPLGGVPNGEPAAAPAPASTGNTGGAGSGGSRSLPGYLRNPRPAYPRLAAENGWEGTTLLRVEVLPNGTAGRLEILESSGHEVLDQAALATMRRWRFIPARRNNIAVEAWVAVPINFTLTTKTASLK